MTDRRGVGWLVDWRSPKLSVRRTVMTSSTELDEGDAVGSEDRRTPAEQPLITFHPDMPKQAMQRCGDSPAEAYPESLLDGGPPGPTTLRDVALFRDAG